jgi:hypothetical protein
MTDRKKTGAAFWATVVVVGAGGVSAELRAGVLVVFMGKPDCSVLGSRAHTKTQKCSSRLLANRMGRGEWSPDDLPRNFLVRDAWGW